MSWFSAILHRLLPTPLERPLQQQQVVDTACRQLALYHFPACPFCLKVRWHIHRLNLNIELRNAQDIVHRKPLIQYGQLEQVPCLRISHTTEDDQWLYESDAIINYLNQHFSA